MPFWILVGRWGKRVAHGIALSKVFTDKDVAMDVIEKTILLYREQGRTSERLSQTMERLGFENVEAQLSSINTWEELILKILSIALLSNTACGV